MGAKQHIICVPFTEAGHSITMLNLAYMLAAPARPVHILALSPAAIQKWLVACGQDPTNPNVHIHHAVLPGENRADVGTLEAHDLVGAHFGPGFESAVRSRIQSIQASLGGPDDKICALVADMILGDVFSVAKEFGLRKYLMSPVAGYIVRLCAAFREDEPLDSKFEFRGIGGKEDALLFRAADFMEGLRGAMSGILRRSFDAADVVIETSTNDGLEGSEKKQAHLPSLIKLPRSFSLGTSLPQWYERALEDDSVRSQHAEQTGGDVLRFLDSKKPKSTVYVALGSQACFDPDQARLVIGELRRHGVNWVLVYRHDTGRMQKELDGEDGLVTGWAPQLDILLHSSVKCVIGHAGFGTMIESIFAGQCCILSPVMGDQFLDALVLQHLGIAVGLISVNPGKPALEMDGLKPTFRNDNGQHVREVFARIFASAEGEAVLEVGRTESRRLRDRMIAEKVNNGQRVLDALIQDMTQV